ncbi:hypothetical protein Smic_69530 [Streptomyces microflavus]|uniref:Uncharacterized protein n=1 Tax=Streptomyces microflavus TaxID=1919 RepID=A0A7J0D2V3_STRMI|nr:hypothetical protein Smic_69530 [Streptomyces microflavus]
MWSMPQRAVTATTADSMARVSAPARNSSRPWRSANRIQATAVASSTSYGSGKAYPSNSVPYSRSSSVDSLSRNRASCSRRSRRRASNAATEGLPVRGPPARPPVDASSEDTDAPLPWVATAESAGNVDVTDILPLGWAAGRQRGAARHRGTAARRRPPGPVRPSGRRGRVGRGMMSA